MPNLNQKGPSGQGPMTGQKRGKCTNFNAIPKNNGSTLVKEQEEPNVESVQPAETGFSQNRKGKGLGCGRRNRQSSR